MAAVVATVAPAHGQPHHDSVPAVSPFPAAQKDLTVLHPDHPVLLIGQHVTAFAPASGPTGEHVLLTGQFPYVAPTAVRFGALPAASFSRRPDGTIAAIAPFNGIPGSAVRITVVDKGVTSESDGLFAYRIADMNVTGPLPLNTSQIGDASWFNGHGHLIRSWAPAILAFSEPPVFHVAIGFTDDSMANPPSYTPPFSIGNFATFQAQLQNCDISQRPPSAASACKNWDGNAGTWVNAGPSVGARLDSRHPNAGESGDLAVKTGALFDQANLVRTLRLVLDLQQNDTHHSTGDRVDTKTSSPFIAVIAPSAFIQVKVVPFTIIYQPPGNASTASYQTLATYSTSFKLGSSNEQSNSTTSQQTLSSKASVKLTLPLAMGSSAAFGMDLGETWDSSTKAGFATSEGSTDATTATLALQTTWNLPADTDLIPGNGDTCISATDCSTHAHAESPRAIEPFWADTFVFLVHPQFAVWVLDAGKSHYVMTAAVPVTVDATVAQLAACWQGSTSWPGTTPCELQYAHTIATASGGGVRHGGLSHPSASGGVVITGAQDHVTLTPEEAHRFLLLDPFFRGGQSAAIRADRALTLSSTQYGARIGERARPVTMALTRTLATSTERAGSTTTTLSITSVRGSDTSYNVGESLFGVLGMTGSSGTSVKSSASSDLKATFTDSTVISQANATQAQVTLNDLDVTSGNCALPHCHLPLPQRPVVNIFLDRQFGGFMFQDPAAAPNDDTPVATPMMRQRTEAAIAAVRSGVLHGARLVLADSHATPLLKVKELKQLAPTAPHHP
jgi:hypothetical protein